MLRKVCPGPRQEAERRRRQRPPGDEAASAPPSSDPRVCIMSIHGGTVNRGSRASLPARHVVRWHRAFTRLAGGTSKTPVLQKLSRDSGFDPRTWRQRGARRAWSRSEWRRSGSCIQCAVHTRLRGISLRFVIPQRHSSAAKKVVCGIHASPAIHPRRCRTAPHVHQRSFTVSIATKVEVCATCGRAEMRSPRTRR